MKLFPKLLLAFLAVVLLGGVAVAFLANRAAEREVRGFMFGNVMTTEVALAQELAGYYRGHGSWDDVQYVLPPGGRGMGHMMDQRLLVADVNALIVADTEHARLGQWLSAEEVRLGQAIEVDNARVGTLLAQGGMGGFGPDAGRPSEIELIGRVNRAIWLAALAAGATALVVGGFMAYNLARPLQRLTVATQAVARGDLSHRVPEMGRDEIGELASAFNTMTVNLQNAEQLRREMTADIAHELRNPLAVLQSNLEGVLDGVLAPTEDNLRPLLEQTQLLNRMVDDLRTLALADAGQLSLDRAPSDMAALVRSVVARFGPAAEAKRIALRVETAADLPLAFIDPQRIEQVLGNLLSNALRHTPEAGVISVQLSVISKSLTTDHRLLITVSDSGPGIPPEDLPHIFERFYRVDKARARADGGTGLGLTIAKQLVEAHGGTMSAANTPEGGAQVSFTAPVGPPAA